MSQRPPVGIEQGFEEAKTELGMDHYEVRKFPGGSTTC